MKFQFHKVLFGVIITLVSGCKVKDPWTILMDKTWRSEAGFGGSEWVFYESANGLKKSIHQIHGSGVPVVMSVIFDVEVQEGVVFLKDGLDLVSGDDVKRSVEVVLQGDSEIVVDSEVFRKKLNHLMVFNWQLGVGETETLGAEKLKNAVIGKQSIYRREDFKD